MSKLEFIMDHDDVRPPARRMAGIDQRRGEAACDRRVRFEDAVLKEVVDGDDAGAREFREIAVVVIASPSLVRIGHRIERERRETAERGCERGQAPDAERIEPPQRIHQGNRDQPRQDHRPAQIRKDREQERDRVAVDHHEVDEVHRHLRDVVLEARQQHQHDDQGQRQRARQRGPRAAARSRGNSGCPRRGRSRAAS